MLFRRPDRAVAQEQLNGSQLGTGFQQAHGKRIAKPMRVAILDAGSRQQVLDCAAGSTNRRIELLFTVPEKVRRVVGQGGQSLEGLLWQADIHRSAGFHHTQHQLAGRHIETGAREFHRIGNAEARIQQGKHQGTGFGARALSFERAARIGDFIACRQEPRNLVAAERQRWRLVGFRNAQVCGRIFANPLALDTETEKRPDGSDFHSGRIGDGGAGAPVVRQGLQIQLRNMAASEGRAEMGQRAFVAPDGRWLQVSGGTVGQEIIDGLLDLGSGIDQHGRQRPRTVFYGVEAGLRLGPATGFQRRPLALAGLVRAIHPHRAITVDVPRATGTSKAAPFFVASIEAIRASTIQHLWHVLWYARFYRWYMIANTT